MTKIIFKINFEYFQFRSAEFALASNPQTGEWEGGGSCSVTNLEVLAGGFDGALVHTLVLHRLLAAGGFLQF